MTGGEEVCSDVHEIIKKNTVIMHAKGNYYTCFLRCNGIAIALMA